MRGLNKNLIPAIKWGIEFILILVFIWVFLFDTTAQTGDIIQLNAPSAACVGASVNVVLNWTSNIQGNPTYLIMRKAAGDPDYSQVGSINGLSFADTSGIDSDKDHSYQIRIQNGTAVSNEMALLAQYCSAVQSPPQTACQESGPIINLSWTKASGNVQKYEIWRDDAKIGETQGSNNNFSDSQNIEGTKNYDYALKTVWQTGVSTSSDAVPVLAPACPPVLAASGSCASASVGGPKIELSWNSLLGVQNYQIYRRGPNENEYALLATQAQTNFTDYLVQSLPDEYFLGGNISYYVRAIWQTDQKNSNAETTAISQCAPYLSAESRCSTIAPYPPEMNLSWTATLGATHYNIYVDGAYATQVSGINNTTYLDQSPCQGLACENKAYQIQASAGGAPLPSNSVTKSVDCSVLPDPSPAPVISAPSAFCESGVSKIRLNWTPSNYASYYTVWNIDDMQFLDTALTWLDYQVQSLRQYSFFVDAVGAGGHVTPSQSTAPIASVSCVPPSASSVSLNASCDTGRPYLDISWGQTTNTEAYELWRGPTPSNLSLLTTFDKNSPEFLSRTWRDYGVSASATYYYKIISKGPTGVPSTDSSVRSAMTSSCIPTTPDVTSNNAFCQSGNSAVDLAWNTSGSNTTRYEIFRQDYQGGTTPYHIIYDVAARNWTDTNVLPQTSYVYKVEAVGYLAGQRSGEGWQGQVTTPLCASPGSFTLADPMISCQGPYLKADPLSWTASANANSYDLLRNGSTVAQNVSSPMTDYGLNNSLAFGGNDIVTIYDNSALRLNSQVSAEAWIYRDPGTSGWQTFMAKLNGSREDLYLAINDETLYLGLSPVFNGYTSVTIEAGKLTHIAMTYNGTTVKIFKNGSLAWSANASGNPYLSSNWSSLTFGGNTTWGEYLNGYLDEVRIYGRSLSDSEVSEHANAIFNNDAGLAGLWHFEENSSQTQYVYDSTNNFIYGVLGTSASPDSRDPATAFPTLQPQTNNSWQAKAVNQGGETFSNQTATLAAPVCVPTKPGVNASSYCQDGISASTIRWAWASTAVKYEVYRQDAGLIKTINPGDPEFLSHEWSDDNNGAGLEQGTDYDYSVKAIGPTGLSSQSDSYSINAMTCTTPTKPQNVSATMACSGSTPRMKISWNDSQNTAYYEVYRQNPTLRFVAYVSDNNSPSYTAYDTYANGVRVNTSYTYYVVAYSDSGQSTTSDAVSTPTGQYCPPSKPTITSGQTTCENNSPANTVGWSDATTYNTSAYQVFRNTSASGPASEDLINTINSGTPEFTTRNWKDNLALETLKDYYYWLKAVGPAGTSATSTSKKITTLDCAAQPDPPALSLNNLICTDSNMAAPTLSWTSSANALSYNLYRQNPDDSNSVYSTNLSPLTDLGANALNFNGVNQYVRVAHNSTLSPSRVTMEAWIKPNAYNSYGNVISKRSQYYLRLYGTTGRINSSVYAGGAWRSCTTDTGVVVPLGQWSHVVATYDGANQKIYIDGVEKKSCAYSGLISTSGSNALTIGAYTSSSERFNGNIDEARVYGRAISAAEATSHFQGIYLDESALAGAWHFDEGSGATAYDKSGKNNNGTLTNGPAWTNDLAPASNISPLASSQNYRYTVKAIGAGTQSDGSNEILVNKNCLPAKPAFFATAGCDGEISQMVLDWDDDPEDNTLYWTVHKRRVGESSESSPFPQNTSVPSIEPDSDIVSGLQYEYWVEAIGRSGALATSDIVSQTAKTCYEGPAEPQVTAEPKCAGYGSRVLLTWQEDPGGKALSYNIWRKNLTDGEADFTEIFNGLPANLLQYLNIVDENKSYQYQVEAVGADEDNAISDATAPVTSLSCSLLPPSPPVLSLNFVLSTGDYIATSFKWTDAGNEEFYRLFRRVSGTSEWTEVNAPDVPIPGNDDPTQDAGWVDYSVTDNQIYEYQVIAYNGNGPTNSNILTVNVPTAVPGNFSLSSETVGNHKIRLTWTDAATTAAGGPVVYRLLRDDTTDFHTTTICDNLSSLECVDNNLSISETYYKVVATNNGGSTDSNIVQAESVNFFWKELSPW